jgi:hypothetical protein
MSLKSLVSYKHLVGCILRGADVSGGVIETVIAGYKLDYDDQFKQSDGHAGSMIHTLTFADGTSFTFSNFGEVIRKYGELGTNTLP